MTKLERICRRIDAMIEAEAKTAGSLPMILTDMMYLRSLIDNKMGIATPEFNQETVKETVKELYYWQYKGWCSFKTRLFETIHCADPINKRKLSICFPSEFMAYMLWHSADSQKDFFKKWGVSDKELED